MGFRRDWLLPAMLVGGIATFTALLILTVFVIRRDRERARADAEIAAQARRNLLDQITFEAYVLCRSQGRSKHDCRLISNGVVLSGSVNRLEADIAKLGEAKVAKLFVGPKGTKVTAGKISIVGPAGTAGKTGQQGPRGPQGPQGAQGPRGLAGQRGPAGPTGAGSKQGPRGQPGAKGATGPAGPQGAKGDQGTRGEPGAKGEQGATGPAGQAGPPGPSGTSCPAGFAPATLSINMPGGQRTIYVCVQG